MSKQKYQCLLTLNLSGSCHQKDAYSTSGFYCHLDVLLIPTNLPIYMKLSFLYNFGLMELLQNYTKSKMSPALAQLEHLFLSDIVGISQVT